MLQEIDFAEIRNPGTGANLYLTLVDSSQIHWDLTAEQSTPSPVHLDPNGIGWSNVCATGDLVIKNIELDLVEPAFEFLRMISDVLPTSTEADEIGDRLIGDALGSPKIRPLIRRIPKK